MPWWPSTRSPRSEAQADFWNPTRGDEVGLALRADAGDECAALLLIGLLTSRGTTPPLPAAPTPTLPGGTRTSRGRIETGAFEDRPDRGGADLATQAGEFSGDAPISPLRVLVGEAQNQSAQRR